MNVGFCRLVAIGTSVVLFFYWAVTFLYCTPNNPVRIAFNDEMIVFERFWYQKWSFFAPPGKFNHRLYYEFSSPTNPAFRLKVEVLSPIWKLKQQKHPFNEQVEVLDYILAGSADQVQDQIGNVYSFKKVVDDIQEKMVVDGESLEEDLSDEFGDLMDKILDADDAKKGPLKTLVNYSKLVAKNAGLEAPDLKCQLTYQLVDIPSFHDRHLSFKRKEFLLYRTNVFDVPK